MYRGDYRYPDGVNFFLKISFPCFISPPSRLTDGAIKDCRHTSAMRQLKLVKKKAAEKNKRNIIKIIEQSFKEIKLPEEKIKSRFFFLNG